MSPSMWAWRVVVPGLGLAACSLILWQSTRAESVGRPPAPIPTSARPPAAASARVIAEGRIAARPGAEVAVGTESGGLVVDWPAREGSRVRKGDLLVAFRDDDLRSALVEAEAKVAEVDAERVFLDREYGRRAKSPTTDATRFQADLDGFRRDLDVANARRKGAVAAVERCRSALARARIASPIDGTVIARLAEVGEVIAPGSRLVVVCDLARLRVEAEVDEFDAGRVRPGDEVTIRAEGSEAAWPAKVEEVPDRIGPRTLRPEDPGRPSDTRVLLVKIAADRPLPLKLGQQVEVEIRPRP